MRRPTQKQLAAFSALILLALISLGALLGGYQVQRSWQLQSLEDRAADALQLYASELRLRLIEHRVTPDLLARHPDIVTLLRQPTPDQVGTVNRLLELTSDTLGTSDLYVMDHTGLTLAASNWRAPKTFIGKNFSYRPYFIDALKGDLGRFFGLGTTSRKRGYYYAAPVRYGGTVVGVMAAKIAIEPLENLWVGTGTLMITDDMGIVFLSSEDGLRYRGLRPLDDRAMARIGTTRQYDPEQVTPLRSRMSSIGTETGKLVTFEGEPDLPAPVRGEDLLMVSLPLDELDGTAHVLVPTDGLTAQGILFTVLLGLALASLWLLGLVVVQRRRNLQQRRAFERAQREQLERSAHELEGRVARRTAELSDANRALHQEIAERKRMENSLRRTQADLIQSEKLAALGKIAVGINHELNQPIGAVRSYADNARKFLERDRTDKAVENLSIIADLTERMGRIVTQLKSFARRDETPAETETISLTNTLAGAMRVVRHRLSDLDVDLIGIDSITDVSVKGRQIGLEQVLTNLISNAADALSERPDGRVLEIRLHVDRGQASLSISDNGPGIPEAVLDNLFDPFFTTKESGAGLGLGLAISQSIVTGCGGILTAENHPGGGARFVVTLPLAEASARPKTEVA